MSAFPVVSEHCGKGGSGRFAAAGSSCRQRMAGAAASLLAHGALLCVALAWTANGTRSARGPAPRPATFSLHTSSTPAQPEAKPLAAVRRRAMTTQAKSLFEDLGRAMAPSRQPAPSDLSARLLPSATLPVAHASEIQPDALPRIPLAEKLDQSARQANYAHRIWLRIMACRPAAVSMEGRVTLSFDLDVSGHLTRSSVISPSGLTMLDRAAIQALHRASPFPVPPDASTSEALHFEVEVRFGPAS
ncbi:energy transducer TonB [Novosphingobium sediminicola]